MPPRLIALAGPLQGRSVALEAASITLGRHASNDLVIRQLSVSRRHARLERDGDGYRLLDLDSLHGTFVNERPIRGRRLVDGDQILLGESLFLYRDPLSAASAAADERSSARLPTAFEDASTAHALVMPLPISASGVPVPASPSASEGAKSAVEALIGESEAMGALRSLVLRVADVASTVLIDGESGCGKELVARVIHAASPRAARPLVTVNCATLSETLLESELFGHERGAFTGAIERRLGQFERAQGGTIFLDEVGEIPLAVQAKLLRVLQEREIERLGGRRTIQVDVRVLAATNRDLAAEVAARRFRDDLFYRLNVIRVTVPPLRERPSDIPLLARHFLFHHARRLQRPSMGLSRDAVAALAAYDWPGNVRELSNAIERAVVLARHPILRPEDLPETVLECRPSTTPPAGAAADGHHADGYHDAVNRAKRELILNALEAAGGNVARAARGLGLSPNYLHRLIGNLGLRDRLDRTRQA